MVVDVDAAGEGRAEALEVVVGHATSSEPCVINTVDGLLTRTTTTAVEPGTWAMLVSAEHEAGSVVIRDISSAVVLEQQAQRRPGRGDEVIRMEDFPDSVDALVLQKGSYQVECRSTDGTATTVPLRVAWDSSAGAESEKDVVRRVFETPDDGQ